VPHSTTMSRRIIAGKPSYTSKHDDTFCSIESNNGDASSWKRKKGPFSWCRGNEVPCPDPVQGGGGADIAVASAPATTPRGAAWAPEAGKTTSIPRH
jgi:hypothetical protein